MILDLTAEQQAFKASIEQFARDVVAPRAAAIDDDRRVPARRDRCGGAARPAGRDDSGRVGRRRSRLRQLRARDRGHRAGQRDGGRRAVGHQLARGGAGGLRGPRHRRKSSGSGSSRPGAAIGAFALSEPDAGTDAANQKTKAVRAGNGYRITGRKVWVANADAASVAIVFACTREGLRGQGVTAFLVPMDTPGVTRRARADSLGVRGLGCQDLDLDIEVRDDQVLGPVDQGFRLAMWALQGGRIAIAAQALGIGEAALDEALAYAKTREVFGQPIANYQAIQWMLADMATELDAARMLTLKAAAEKDRQGPRVVAEASMAKLAASEAAHKAADKAMQILASAGYRRGSTVERLFRDVRATEIYQGTSEAQRMIIAASLLSSA